MCMYLTEAGRRMANETEPDSSQWNSVTAQDAMDTNGNIGNPFQRQENTIFFVRVIKYWNSLPKEVLESPAQEISKTQLGKTQKFFPALGIFQL